MIPPGTMYRLEYTSTVVAKDIPRLSADIKKRIKKTIEKKLRVDPLTFGKPLRYSLRGLRSLRIGDYRVIYSLVFERKCVLIVKIGHRKEVYED